MGSTKKQRTASTATMSKLTHHEAESVTNTEVVSLDKTDTTQHSNDDPQPVQELDTDAVFHLLKNRRRRDVLRFLGANSGAVTLGAVAEYVAARENDITVTQLSSKQRKRVYVALYQCHLPMMADYGVITFNRPRGYLELTPTAVQLEPYLNDEIGDSEQWSAYLTVTVFGSLLYLFGGLLVGLGSWYTTMTVVGLIGSITVLALREGRDDIAEAIRVSAATPIARLLEPAIGSGTMNATRAADDAVADD